MLSNVSYIEFSSAFKTAWLGLVCVLVSNAMFVHVAVCLRLVHFRLFAACCAWKPWLCLLRCWRECCRGYVLLSSKYETNQGSGVGCGRVESGCWH